VTIDHNQPNPTLVFGQSHHTVPEDTNPICDDRHVKPPRCFEVGGPFDVPTVGPARNRAFGPRKEREHFWDHLAPGWGDRIGCYVFGLRRAKGILPIYVGRTKKRFRAECFNPANYEKLHTSLRN